MCIYLNIKIIQESAISWRWFKIFPNHTIMQATIFLVYFFTIIFAGESQKYFHYIQHLFVRYHFKILLQNENNLARNNFQEIANFRILMIIHSIAPFVLHTKMIRSVFFFSALVHVACTQLPWALTLAADRVLLSHFALYPAMYVLLPAQMLPSNTLLFCTTQLLVWCLFKASDFFHNVPSIA